jgi:hypothetical protein
MDRLNLFQEGRVDVLHVLPELFLVLFEVIVLCYHLIQHPFGVGQELLYLLHFELLNPLDAVELWPDDFPVLLCQLSSLLTYQGEFLNDGRVELS